MRSLLLVFCAVLILGCRASDHPPSDSVPRPAAQGKGAAPVVTGAENTAAYLSDLRAQRIAVVANQASRIGQVHLVDSLLSAGIDIVRILVPEHGFRGTADAGAHVSDGTDPRTGLPVVSLYGSNKKPTPGQLAGIDRVVFDLQDVGVRFYTYISTLHYVLEACAENDVPVTVLDRPNPNAHYVDGPVLDPAFASFVGMHPVPVVYGMTIGEYARMTNAEFLPVGLRCDLTVVPCLNYDHFTRYDLPVRPSPNLPNAIAVDLYPSLCFFEGTVVSVGRGTDRPFQIYGHPGFPADSTDIVFTPAPTEGATNPKLNGRACHGFDLRHRFRAVQELDLNHLLTAFRLHPEPAAFFLENGFFDKLAGTDALRTHVLDGWSEEAIRATWQSDLEAFRTMRARYLLYP